MTTSRRVAAALLALLAACRHDASVATIADPEPVAPMLASANGIVGVVVGSAVTYDATKGGTAFSDPTRGGLTYTVSFGGPPNGLMAANGAVVGTPTTPGVTTATITATDSRGRAITDRFTIVAFARGLPSPRLPSTLARYSDASSPLPAHYVTAVDGPSVLATDNTPPNNPTTDAGATLGRVLFYDPRLSASDGTSCASCHVQSLGFSDASARSVGFDGKPTARHSPGLSNARFYRRGRFFWDERAPTLEAQVLAPIQDATEMGLSLDALVLKLSATPYYAPLFAAAFGTPTIDADRVARALAQYTRSLVSANSRYDRAFGPIGPPNFASTLTALERQGEQLFRTSGCAACHATVAMIADAPFNTGLDATITDAGAGNGTFKAPSLRNVGVRQRFMHDGRFATLAEVVDFYDGGVQPNPGLDPRLRGPNGAPRRLGLTSTQKDALVAFLHSLTDSTFLSDARFSDPFAIDATAPAPPAASTSTVVIQGAAYRPATLTVSPGTVLTFTNLDNARHSADFSSAAIGTTGIFMSGSRTVTMPATPGTYGFQCAIHGPAMTGTITVR